MATIKRPEVVRLGAKHPDRENVYHGDGLPPPDDGLHLKVVAAWRAGDVPGTFQTGWIVTAYPTKAVGRGERQRFP